MNEEKPIKREQYPFVLPCIICERAFNNGELLNHYKTHTIEEILKELMNVSDSLYLYGEYA